MTGAKSVWRQMNEFTKESQLETAKKLEQEMSVKETPASHTDECTHTFVNVGFTTRLMVCKHCNEEE